MARFRIPTNDGRRATGASQQIDPANTFGKKIEKVINPVMPTAEAFGAAEAESYGNMANAVDRTNNAVTNMINREERLRQSEEKNKSKLAKVQLEQERQNAENELKEQAYTERWSADTFKEKLQERVAAKADELRSEEYSTYVGDRFRAELDLQVKDYEASWKSPGSTVEKYRTDKILEHTNESIETMQQVSAASGQYDMMMKNVQTIREIHQDPTNVIAMGGEAQADANFIHTMNEHYIDHIKLQIQRDPAKALDLLSTQTDKDVFSFYDGLDPQKRTAAIVMAGTELRRRNKAKKDALIGAATLDHAERTGIIPFNDPKFKKHVNEAYKSLSIQNQSLPTDQRYHASREFVKKYQIIPSDLKNEIQNTFGSLDAEEVQSASKYVANLLEDNPSLSSELPKEIVTAAILTKSGMSAERLSEVVNNTRNMTVSQKDGYDSAWKEQKFNDNITSYSNSIAKDISGNWFSTPSIDGDFSGQAGRLIKAYYPLTGGDIEAAQELALLDMKKTWAVTEIDGSERMMQFAPEVMVANGGESGWMKDQLQDDIFEETGLELKGMNYRLIPTAGTFHGQEVAYMVMAQDENGLYAPVSDESNQPIHWQPDYAQTAEYQEEQREVLETEVQAYEDNLNARLMREYEIRFRKMHTQEFLAKRNAEINQAKNKIQDLQVNGKAINKTKIDRLKLRLKAMKEGIKKPEKIELEPTPELAEFLKLKWFEVTKDEEESEYSKLASVYNMD